MFGFLSRSYASIQVSISRMTARHDSPHSFSAIHELSEDEKVKLLAAELRGALKHSAVVTPDSEGYAESIKRWSDAVEKRAVSWVDSSKAEGNSRRGS
jgi:hypothetical protein